MMGCYCYWRYVYFTNVFRADSLTKRFISYLRIFFKRSLNSLHKYTNYMMYFRIWLLYYNHWGKSDSLRWYNYKQGNLNVDVETKKFSTSMYNYKQGMFSFSGLAIQFSTTHRQQATGNSQFKSVAEPRRYKWYLFAHTVIINEKYK